MEKVYIIHPFRGKEENMKKIGEICKRVSRVGYLPVSPVHAFSFLDDHDPRERMLALTMCRELVVRCDEAWAFGDWRTSEGCLGEIEVASFRRIPIWEVVNDQVLARRRL